MIRVALPFGKTPESKRVRYREALRLADIEAVEGAATLAGLHGVSPEEIASATTQNFARLFRLPSGMGN